VGAEVPVLKDLPEGYEMMTIDIEPEPSVQPGVFVNVRGRFDMNPDDRREQIEVRDVLYDVQVKGVGGSSEPAGQRRRSTDNIQIFLPKDHVKRLLQIKERMASDRFLVTVRRSGRRLTCPAISCASAATPTTTWNSPARSSRASTPGSSSTTARSSSRTWG